MKALKEVKLIFDEHFETVEYLVPIELLDEFRADRETTNAWYDPELEANFNAKWSKYHVNLHLCELPNFFIEIEQP